MQEFGVAATRVILLVLIAAGIGFRVVGLGWGIPSPLAPEATSCRSSFHLDEDDYLWGVTRINARKCNFDVGDYHWGTLQFYLIAGSLEAGERLGYLRRPWQDSFLKWNVDDFPRIYLVGRAVSALAGILSLLLVFKIGKLLKDFETGLTAAAFLAVAPFHVVSCHFLTADVTMVFLLLASIYFLLSSLERDGIKPRVAGGLLLGLAIATKYNAVCLLPLWAGCEVFQRGTPWKTRMAGYIAIVAGFALGEPYAFLHRSEIAEAVSRALTRSDAAAPFLLSWPRLFLEQGKALGQYGLGWTLAVSALIGIFWWFVRPSRKKIALAAAIALIAASVIAAKWPMLRYTLPLIPIGALSAAMFITDLPIRASRRVFVSLLVAALPLSMSWAQVRILMVEHTANQASHWIQENIPPGGRIGQIWRELPPLDTLRFDVHLMHGLFAGDPAAPEDLNRQFLVLDDLPILPFTREFNDGLAQEYVLQAEFRSTPHVGPWLLDESGAPHDWKYTHPVVRIYVKER